MDKKPNKMEMKVSGAESGASGSTGKITHAQRLEKRGNKFEECVIESDNNRTITQVRPDTCVIQFKFLDKNIPLPARGKINNETHALALEDVKKTLNTGKSKNLIIDLSNLNFKSEIFFTDLLNLDLSKDADIKKIYIVGIDKSAQDVLKLVGIFSKLKYAISVEQALDNIARSQIKH